jgi:thioredoxin-related protein
MKVLKFGSVQCAGCVVMKPRWKEIEDEMPNLETQYFELEQDKKSFEENHITNIPTFIFLDKGGNEITRLYGEVEKEKLMEVINENKNR